MKAIQKIKSNLSKIIKVLRHGILSLYSYIRKFIPWRSRTSTDLSDSSASSLTNANRISHSNSISSYIRSLRNVRIAGMSSSIMFGLLALAIIIPLYNVSGTEDTEAATSYNEASITLTAVRSSATITADANTLGSSSFALISSNLTSSDTTQYAEYNVKTTNATGYTIGIATNTASTSTNLTSGSNTLSSLAYNTTTMNGISSSDYNNLNTTSYNNTWALYPGTVGNSANSKFYPISNNTITMGTTTAANSTVTSSNTYKVGLAARITMDQAAGTYTTTSNDNFKVTAVGNAAAYTISYNANGGDESTLPNPNPESSTSYSQQSVTLSSTTPTKTGYDFLGWCTKQTSDQTTQSNGSTACTNAGGTYYSAGGDFYIDETTTNITTLYAIWYLKDITVTGVFGGSGVTGINFANQTYGDKSITTNNGTTTLKYGASYTISGSYSSGYEFSSWAATAGSLGSTSSDSTTYSTTSTATLTLTGKSSAIALNMNMQDFTVSKCSSLTTNTTYSITDSRDNSLYTIAKLADDHCWMTQNLRLGKGNGEEIILTSNDSNVPSNFTLKASGMDSTSPDATGDCNVGNWHPSNTSEYFDKSHLCINTTDTNKYGIYYNWYTATAGTGTYSMTTGNASGSICPKGWILPPVSGERSYYNLLTTKLGLSGSTGSTTMQNAPYNFPLSGYSYGAGISFVSSSGGFWSSSANNNTNAYFMYFYSSDIYPHYNYNKGNGYSVRCVFDDRTLYDTIASMSKGKQTNDTNATTGIQAAITAPTSTDRTQDTSNSGVYEYNASLFGASSDASNDYKIYYYRGILEPEADQGSYGSDGKATTYPNYVKLSNNTCWRIFRTTGSGGVKLIYNGTYGATTAGSCANAQTKAQLTTKAFDTTANSSAKSIVGVGYTYNATYKSKTNTTVAGALFGTNTNYSGNTSPSTMKTYIEDTWYKSNMTSYTSKLEPSAGYCNDRSVNSGNSWTSYSDTTSITTPYSSASSGRTTFYFGAYMRNNSTAQKPSLTCPRNVVDLYTTSSASNGNKQLTYPVALATADEMSFAGSGDRTASNGSSYNAKSFAGSGSSFWLLSPNGRYSNGGAYGYYLYGSGYLYSNFDVNGTQGVRPVISLKFGTTPESGSGTATDPWVVTPPTMQDATSSSLADLMPNVGDTVTLVDSRDGSDYTVAKLADDHYWMTQNLRLGKGSGEEIILTSSDSNVSSDFTLKASGMGTKSPDATGDCNVGDWWSLSNATYFNVSHLCINTTDTEKYGVYYNWYTATAGTGKYETSSGNATSSICPKGWILPPYSGDRSYYNLLFTKAGLSSNSTSSTTMQNAPYNFPLSGYTYGTGISNVGSYGYFWSSSACNNTYAYNLYFNSSSIGPQNDGSKGSGYSVRCVFGS